MHVPAQGGVKPLHEGDGTGVRVLDALQAEVALGAAAKRAHHLGDERADDLGAQLSVVAAQGDGDVLVMQFDSKGLPTATEEELRRRRGKRTKRAKAPSPRHRGRSSRTRWTKKPRRKKGDKAKNAKMGTMVVMYTLRSEGGLLLGPINKRYYGSFAPKRHAFVYARREESRRGFPPGTKRTVQIVTDGDNDLGRYAAEFFPGVLHTVDIAHVVEKLWDAGSSLHREGSAEHHAWVEAQKTKLYAGKPRSIVAELDRHLARIALSG